ncbi:facilitated trehalose transporter Tret1-like isoform X2 [Penaeus monodon]|uniref:facilitated trehalose transporter Tret1-like isoform X2 n=1 Tax=Penaeus monodon TaxID=6687 RepID=UPI0018A7C834|nr:facilitated trehalose transporter Tret1-like isoform X2 [Penaeus monodon]
MDVYTVEEHGESSAGRGGRESSAERRTRLLRQGLKMFMCSLAMWTMGSMYVFPSVLAHDLAAHNTTIYGSPITLTSSQVDMAGSLVMLGSTVGAWVVAPLMMRLGRRACILGSGSTAVLGWLGVALLPEPVGILVARGLSGMAAGGLSLVANSYGIELADPEVRGMMAMVLNLGILLGQVVTVSVGYDARYFIVALVDMALPLALLLSLFHLPESPPYLVLKGYQVISANTSRMFEAAGSSLDDSLATIIVNVVQVAAAVAASLLMDRLGRRRSTMLSYGVMCAALGGLAVYLLAAGEQDPRPLAWVPLVCLMVTQGAVTVGVNPVPFILSSEYFPTRIRAWAAGICYTVGNLAGFLALQLYTPMLEALGQVGLYAFYSAVCLAGVPFTYFFVRETTGAKVG